LADLAVSFPALLFALAVPRPGLVPARAVAEVIAGAPLARAASAAHVPMWLRRLPPEAFVAPLTPLPDGELFRRRIVNHVPRSTKLAPVWLQAMANAADWAGEPLAIWIARELVRDTKAVQLDRLRLVSLWAWFSGQSGTLGHDLIEQPWVPGMRFVKAAQAADSWRMRIALQVNLGAEPIADMWLEPAIIDGYAFTPLRSTAEIVEEATLMKNCLRSYGYNLAHNRSRLWRVSKDGNRIATLCVATRLGDPLPTIAELRAPRNAEAPAQVWWAARRWLHMHDLSQVDMKRRKWGTAPLDRGTWVSLWRPYWLAKRRIPAWLPIKPSRAALNVL
jgi:hypothetical protein